MIKVDEVVAIFLLSVPSFEVIHEEVGPDSCRLFEFDEAAGSIIAR
jgi:hypothetical protein